MNHWSKNHSLQEQASDVVRKHMMITGLVQGVGFRYFTVIQARQLGVSGWVRNDVRHIDIQDVPVKDDAPSAFRVLE